eukprot:TRINITY_DN16219_c0_g1_i1.p1 TRINITY_DN16219_c0_g1~~TRINITY_DN16219_c0_g1_i1.p1  ORF type:complete len:979 (+),score=357.99 TRINITY_DN16219_c0_g1_i1:94-2937(+)
MCSADQVKKHSWIAARDKYLHSLCAFLRQNQLVAEVVPLTDNFNKTVLSVKGPADPSSEEGWVVYIHAGIELSSAIVAHMKQPVTISRSPFYSQLVMQDHLLPSLYETIHHTFGSISTLTDTAILLKIWAAKQGISDTPDGLSDTLIFSTLVYLATTGMISEAVSVDQAFRLALQFLTDLPPFLNITPHPEASLGTLQVTDATTATHNALKAEHPQVLVYEGWNVWYNSTEHALKEIKMMAKNAVGMLDTYNANDAIEGLFKIPTPFWLKFDIYAVVPCPEAPLAAKDAKHDSSFTSLQDFTKFVYKKLQIALGEELLRTRSKVINGNAVFGIGLYSADSLSVKKFIIEGPPLMKDHQHNTEEVNAFNEVWGPRSKTTQEHGGVVRKSASFTEATNDLDYLRLMLITLLRNIKLKGDIRVLGEQAEYAIQIEKFGSDERYDPMAELRHRIGGSLTQLTEYLRTLDDFPLQIISVDGAPPALRNAAVAPPHPHASLLRVTDEQVPDHLLEYGDGVEPMEVVIGFSRTSAWPDHKEAVDNIKMSIYCRLASRLRKERRLVCIPRRDCVDVLMNGYVFRLYVFHPKEVALLNALGFEGAAQVTSKQLDLLPKHSEMVGSYAAAFAAFSPGLRLLKRWASAHMMSSYVTEEALELVMCKVYSYDHPPRSALTAFTRALHLVASWAWDTLAMSVPPLSGDTSSLSKKRGEGPAMWFNTTYDSQHSVFSANTPNGVMLRRLTGLAQATLMEYFQQMQEHSVPETWEHKWKALFVTSMKPFDVVVTLNRDVVKHPRHALGGKKVDFAAAMEAHPKGYLFRPGCETRREELHKMIGYDPVSWYVSQIRRNFREHCMVAYDQYGGGLIGVVGLKKFTAEEAQRLAEHLQGMGSGIVKRVQASNMYTQPEETRKPSPKVAAKKVSKKRKAEVEAEPEAEAPAKKRIVKKKKVVKKKA